MRPRALRRALLLLGVLGVAAVGSVGCPSVGRQVVVVRAAEPDSSSKRPIKIASFNLFNRPWDRQTRLARAKEELLALDADVVALQEVSEGWFAGEDAKRMLATLPYPHQAYFMLERWGPFVENGLYLLSRWPLREPTGTVHQTNRAFNRKGFVAVTIDAPGVRLNLINLHHAATRRRSITLPQAEALAGALRPATPGELSVVVGDFNARLDEAPLERILAAGRLVAAQGSDPAAPRSWAPYGSPCADPEGERIDHVLVSQPSELQPWRVIDQGVVQPRKPYPSDHCLVWAVVAPVDVPARQPTP